METLLAALSEIRGHLGAARAQRIPSDDKIIAEHIDEAYFLAHGAIEAARQLAAKECV